MISFGFSVNSLLLFQPVAFGKFKVSKTWRLNLRSILVIDNFFKLVTNVPHASFDSDSTR